MDVPESAIITWEGWNGKVFNIAGGDLEGAEGVGLAMTNQGTAWEDLFESPFETIYNSTAFEIGGRYGGLRENMFEFTLALHIRSTANTPWRVNDSRFRKAMHAKKDSKLRVRIPGESDRYLNVRLRKQPILKVQNDPNRMKYGLLFITVVASYPRWIEDAYTESHTTQLDTTASGTETMWFSLNNPTNNEAWAKWVLQAGNDGIIYTIPDFSFGDDRFDRAETDEDRMVVMPSLIGGEHVVVDTDEMTMNGQVNSSLDTAIYQRMNGREFLYPIPAYTDPIQVPVLVSKAEPGNVVQLRIPRDWSRPWGLD